MTATLIFIAIIAILVLILVLTLKSRSELKKDFIEEKERSAGYKAAMYENVNLAKKAEQIDIKIEEKKRARKKMSKKDKISNANSRGSSD